MKDIDQEIGHTKRCLLCEEVKPIEEFYKKRKDLSTYAPRCKICSHIGQTIYRQNNAEAHRARNKKWREDNPDAASAMRTKWREDNPDKSRESDREARRRARLTPKGKLNSAVSASMSGSLSKGAKAGRKWETLVGYTVSELIAHLERQFLPGMTWDNYGRNGWHVDHIVPIAAHNYQTPDDFDFKRAWALSNLQPLWAFDNISKGAKLTKSFQPSLALSVPVNEHNKRRLQ